MKETEVNWLLERLIGLGQLVEPLKWQLSRRGWLGTLRSFLCRSYPLLVLCEVSVGIIVFTLSSGRSFASSNIKWIQPAKCRKFNLLANCAKYPGKDLDSRTKLEEMRALYKEKGVKTSSAFLPLLIQMPVLMALFQADVSNFLKSVTSFGWTLRDGSDSETCRFLQHSSHFSAVGWPIKPYQSAMVVRQPWCMWCLWSSSPCSQPAGSHHWVTSNAYQVGQTILEQPLQDYCRAWSKEQASRDMETKTPCPNKVRKAENKKEGHMVLWQYNCCQRFKKVRTV